MKHYNKQKHLESEPRERDDRQWIYNKFRVASKVISIASQPKIKCEDHFLITEDNSQLGMVITNFFPSKQHNTFQSQIIRAVSV